MKNKQIIIIGGGSSINEGIEKGLWDKLKGKVTFGLNYSYNYFKSTAQFYVDKAFYMDEMKKEKFKELPLIIGKYHKHMKVTKNTLMIPACATYDPSLKKGCYKASLCGIYALSVACYLQPKEIFLLGYDYGGAKEDTDKRVITHFYQGKIEHRGIGKVNYYNCRGRGDRDYEPFVKAGHNNILNVSLDSKINIFTKISYDEFLNRLDDKHYSQIKLREKIRETLKTVVQ